MINLLSLEEAFEVPDVLVQDPVNFQVVEESIEFTESVSVKGCGLWPNIHCEVGISGVGVIDVESVGFGLRHGLVIHCIIIGIDSAHHTSLVSEFPLPFTVGF